MSSVALILGSNTPKIEQELKKQLDDTNFQIYNGVESLIRTSGQKGNVDRILISTAGLSKENSKKDLSMLLEFVTQVSVRTSVVFILKEGTKTESHTFFHENFTSPLYTDMVIGKVSIHELKLGVQEEIEDLRRKYSAFQIQEIEVIEDTLDDTENNNTLEKFIVERPMVSLPKIRQSTFTQKLFNKGIEYSPKELKDLNESLEIMKIHMNLLGNSGYRVYENLLNDKEDKVAYMVKHKIWKLPQQEVEKVITKVKLHKEEFIDKMLSRMDFDKDANLSSSEFINRTGKPVIDF